MASFIIEFLCRRQEYQANMRPSLGSFRVTALAYQKGALIAACLDIYLLHLSDGGYGLKNLTHDLGIRFGKNSYFNDDQLFDEIEKLSYPEIKQFLIRYVQGTEPIPYDYYFGLAGIQYTSDHTRLLIPNEQADTNARHIRKIWLTPQVN